MLSTREMLNNGDVLLRLRSGDHDAFSHIYDQYSSSIFGHLLRLVKSKELAQDIVQSTFVALWENRHRIDPERAIRPYLIKIATNQTLNVFKKAVHDKKYRNYLYPILNEGYEHIESEILRKEHRHLVQDVLDQMPPMQRKVFTLCNFEGRSYEEAAELLGISPQTVHTHMKRARQFLKLKIAENPELLSIFLLAISYL